MIPEKTVQEILERARVEDVIEDFVSLRKRGVNLIGLCPFHNEKTPSFTVSPTKNIYKCFGCGQAGSPVNFIMEHESLTYPEALRYLARKYGIQIQEIEVSPAALQEKKTKESLFIVNEFAKDFYVAQLHDTDRGKSVALSYFKGRGFSEETIRKFDLGYAPGQKDRLTQTALQKGYQKEILEKLKLTNQYGSDFFRERVMFTIHNLSGKVVGFAGRILVKDAKAPKYINSPETEIYQKSKILYGAFQAKRAIRRADECIIVEGYTDVISMHQGGIENVVASSGTALTVGQIKLIQRYTPNITLLYDGDAAGIKAALRGLDLVLEQGMNVKVVLLPPGEDPDSYMANVGKDNFQQYIKDQAKDFIFFKMEVLLQEIKNDPIKKTEVIRSIVESIAKIPDPIKRSLYVKECSSRLSIDEQLLINETNKLISKQLKSRQLKETAPPPPSDFPPSSPPEASFPAPLVPEPPQKEMSFSFQEKDIIRILIAGGGQLYDQERQISVAEYIMTNIQDVIDDFTYPLHQKIIDEIKDLLNKKKTLTPSYFTQHQDPAVSKLAIDLSTSPFEYSENWENRWEIFLQTQKMPDENFFLDSQQALMRFRLRKIMEKCNENQELIKKFSLEGNDKKMILHLKVQQKLNDMRSALAKELGTVVLK